MRILEKNKRDQRGMTLFELLIVLAIMAAGVSVAGAAFKNLSPRLSLYNAAGVLVADLKAARLRARQTHEAISVEPVENGYRIVALGIEREFSNGIVAEWEKETDTIMFSGRFSNLGARIKLEGQSQTSLILVHPITGKVERIE